MSNQIQVAVVADATSKLKELEKMLQEQGCSLAVTLMSGEVSAAVIDAHVVDLWVVEVLGEDDAMAVVDLISARVDVPVFVGEGLPEDITARVLRSWRRRFHKKLLSLDLVERVDLPGEQQPVRRRKPMLIATEALNVWVLAASTGGPAAVKEFLDALPSDIPVAFIYAQHINSSFDSMLSKVLGRHNQFNFSMCDEERPLRHGDVRIVPVDHQVDFVENGRIYVLTKNWDGVFSPSLDRVISNVAEVYGGDSGAIIFTGMGNDGAVGSAAMKQVGGSVWAQTAESCAVSSMPDSVKALNLVTEEGTPTELAQALAAFYKDESE